MTVYFKPRRGKKATAISQDVVLKHGEVFFEVPEEGAGSGKGKLKMGDGVTSYSELPYFLESEEGTVLTQEEFNALSPEEQTKGLYYIKDSSSTDLNDNVYLKLENVIDNLDSTDVDKALSANMGRELLEQLEEVKNNPFHNRVSVENIDATDMNFAVGSTTDNTTGTFPSGFYKVGTVISIRRTSSTQFQIYLDANAKMATRILSGGVWGDWDIKVSSKELEPVDGDYIGTIAKYSTDKYAVLIPVNFNPSKYNISCSKVGLYSIGWSTLSSVTYINNTIIVLFTGNYASDSYIGRTGVAGLSFTKK